MTKEDYIVIAPIYKQLMSHVDYPMWASYLLECFDRADHQPGVGLELAGGTGDLAEHLQGRFEKLYGSDLRLGMVDQQDTKLFTERLAFDMCQVPFMDEAFDSLFCLYDSVNYLREESQLSSFLSEAHRVLQPGGVLVFDTVTEVNSLNYFHETLDYEEFQPGDLVRESFYDPDHQMQFTKFIYYKHMQDNVCHKFEEEHHQKIWHAEQISLFLNQAGFEILANYDGFTFDETHAESERIHWVVRKSS